MKAAPLKCTRTKKKKQTTKNPTHTLSVTKTNAFNECSTLSPCSYVLSVCLLWLVNPLPLVQLACSIAFPSGHMPFVCVRAERQKPPLPIVLHFSLSSRTSSTNKVDLTTADYCNEGSPREYAHSHCTSDSITARGGSLALTHVSSPQTTGCLHRGSFWEQALWTELQLKSHLCGAKDTERQWEEIVLN